MMMGRDLTIQDRAVIGDCVRRFTDIENDFKRFGSFMDELISADDTETVIELISNIYLVIGTAMNKNIVDFIDELGDYLDFKKAEQLKESENNDCI